MHAQRCPVAKLLAASQQNNQGKPGKIPSFANPAKIAHLQKRGDGMRSILPSKDNSLLPTRNQNPKNQDKPSFFQKLHGEVAPLLTPCPQMYSEDNWVQPISKDKPRTRDKSTPRKPHELPPVLNENCSIHGYNGRRGSRPFLFPKSISCPTPARIDSRQTANAERLKNWRRSSLTITKTGRGFNEAPVAERQDVTQQPSHSRLPAAPPQLPCRHYTGSHQYPSPLSSIPSSTTPSPSMMSMAKHGISDDLQSRRSQFRKAWSFFSIGCDDLPKEKAPPQRILRQPTRHVYRRGISGLPIDCTNRRSMGVAF